MFRFVYVLILSSMLLVSCGEKKNDTYNQDTQEEGPVRQYTDTTLVDSENSSADNNIVHEGIVDLAYIDQNKDNKVFQCQMDWNVISDHSGNCPLCKMELEEVSISKAKDNLVKNDYQVK